MHTVFVIAGGFVLLGTFVLFGWLWGGSPAGVSLAIKAFLPVWLVVASLNMWIGVSHAGYSVSEEGPILLIILSVPVAFAVLALWYVR